ncbi:MAG: hypothetical protein E3J83_06355 [Candidatus Atribacteria bacterium]|nr:MAG: hypothetical protein E3J83_06355 [Candidatus Atribacteria bacterium]
MLVKKEIDFKEVLRRWAIGEIGSKEFGLPDFKEERKKLKSNQFTETDLEKCLYRRWTCYIPTIAQLNAVWFLKPTKFIINEFPKFYTMNDNGWKQKTNGSYRLIDAIFRSMNYPDENSREFKIIRNFENLDIDDFTGITLIYNKIIKKYIIVEGHARLIAIYNHLVINKRKIRLPLEFAIGITNNKWYFSPF